MVVGNQFVFLTYVSCSYIYVYCTLPLNHTRQIHVGDDSITRSQWTLVTASFLLANDDKTMWRLHAASRRRHKSYLRCRWTKIQNKVVEIKTAMSEIGKMHHIKCVCIVKSLRIFSKKPNWVSVQHIVKIMLNMLSSSYYCHSHVFLLSSSALRSAVLFKKLHSKKSQL